MGQDKTEAYLSSLPADQRAALEKLRRQILAAAPNAAPHFGYGLPGFTLRGHPFIYFGAAKAHCALYGSNDANIAAKLTGFKHSKGAIRFTPEAPLPAALVKEIVKVRAAANEAKWGDAPPAKAPKKAPAQAASTTAKRVGRGVDSVPLGPRVSKAATDGSAAVDAFLAALDHPQRALISAIRSDLREAAPSLAERVKWNAPSMYLGSTDFSAFNLRAKGFVQLVLLFPDGIIEDESGILEGTWTDRRFVRFVDDADRKKKGAALARLIGRWVARRT